MSLLLCYHDERRCCAVSDDRAITFGESGQAIPIDGRVPKFVLVGGLIFAALRVARDLHGQSSL